MGNFNKYLFLESFKSDILNEILNENITDMSDFWEYQNAEIERAVIYYSDCFDICKELNFTDWSDSEFGEITNICQAACVALQEFISEEFDENEIESAIENRERFVEWSHSDNCINVEGGKTQTQCTQYRKSFDYLELFKYFISEYAV